MTNPTSKNDDLQDPNASDRKKDHIDLALKARIERAMTDTRFYYEPLMSSHPNPYQKDEFSFLGKAFNAPIWVSSMTGGTAMAKTINENLAKAVAEYGLGMGLGSCRQLLYSDEFLSDFQVRKFIGEQALYANLGIAQIEILIKEKQTSKIVEMMSKLEADGLIVHVNPLQEWLQPEGDRFDKAPIDTIKHLLDKLDCKIIVKEVGQGMGIKSLDSLLRLPIEAIDFAASGGTNFALLEILRSSEFRSKSFEALAYVGHNAEEMVDLVNQLIAKNPNQYVCNQIIISGGINDFLDGYYFTQKINLHSIYGQASGLLSPAMESYESLSEYLDMQINGLAIAKSFLTVK